MTVKGSIQCRDGPVKGKNAIHYKTIEKSNGTVVEKKERVLRKVKCLLIR